ncbi:MAG: chromate transporter [Myxococcota bacterium]
MVSAAAGADRQAINRPAGPWTRCSPRACHLPRRAAAASSAPPAACSRPGSRPALLAGGPRPRRPWTRLAALLSEAALFCYGGAYAVVALLVQQGPAWAPHELLDALGLAEAPGPPIQVAQFLGYLAASRDPGALSPQVAGGLGVLLAAWVTWAPSLLLTLVSAPHVERIRTSPALASATRAITAAVVGIVASLALWFALHVAFARGAGVAVGLGLLAALLLALRLPRLVVLVVSALLGALVAWGFG